MFSFVERKPFKLALMAALAIVASAAPTFASEAELILPDLASVSFLGMTGRTLLFLGLFVCAAGPCSGWSSTSSCRTCRCTSRCARSPSSSTRPARPTCSPRASSSCSSGSSSASIMVVYFGWLAPHRRVEPASVAHHPALQPGRHRRQLRRGLVRHPHQHLRQLAHRLRRARGASPSRPTPSRSRPACASACCSSRSSW